MRPISIQAREPLENLGVFTLLEQCEIRELVCRVIKAVVNVLFLLGSTLVNCLYRFYPCKEAENPLSAHSWDILKAPSKGLEKLKIYKQLPKNSPEFERTALHMAEQWLAPEERQSISEKMPEGIQLFSTIMTRAAIFNHAPGESERWEGCAELSHSFHALSLPDRMAILDHFDSDIQHTGSNAYVLKPKNDDCSGKRKFIPQKTIISAQANAWLENCKTAIYNGYNHAHHPIMEMLFKM